PVDSELDPGQRHAVIRAVQTPDVALIGGGPGTGKSRVIAEIVRQAVSRGQRVLLTAPTTSALDVVLERLGGDRDVVALRCLGRGEMPESLSPASAARTMAALCHDLVERAGARNRERLDELAQQLTNARAESQLLANLLRLDEEEHGAAGELQSAQK